MGAREGVVAREASAPRHGDEMRGSDVAAVPTRVGSNATELGVRGVVKPTQGRVGVHVGVRKTVKEPTKEGAEERRARWREQVNSAASSQAAMAMVLRTAVKEAEAMQVRTNVSPAKHASEGVNTETNEPKGVDANVRRDSSVRLEKKGRKRVGWHTPLVSKVTMVKDAPLVQSAAEEKPVVSDVKPAPKDGQVVEREEPVVEEKKPIAVKDPEVEYARYVRRGVKGLVRSDLLNARTSNRAGVTDEIAIGMLRDQYAKPKQMRDLGGSDGQGECTAVEEYDKAVCQWSGQ